MTKQRHVRPGDHLDDEDTVVIRGGDLDPDVVRADAERYHAIYGEYGISVFAARDATVGRTSAAGAAGALRGPDLARVGALLAAGFRPEPTGRNPRPVTVSFDDLDRGGGGPRSLRAPQLAELLP